jgi:type I restriction enzyme, S subunit
MRHEWPIRSLREVGVDVLDCEHRTPPSADVGYPYVAIPQMKEGRLDLSSARLITHEHYKEWTRKTHPKSWDVVLSRRCNPGETALAPPETAFALGQNLVILRSQNEEVVPEFLRWLVRGPSWWEQVHTYLNVGAVFDSLRCRDIPEFSLPIPPPPEQRAIAHELGTLDDKIELNRRMNETLEAMARAIFKSWFVDFDPVRAKAEGRQPHGMDPATAALFPDSFQDSPLGLIPWGWEVVNLPGAIDVNPKRLLSKGDVAPYLDMKSMPISGHRPGNWTEREFGSGMRFINGDTLLARITPCLENGKTAFVDFLEDGQIGWGSTEYIVFHPRPPLPVEFAYYLARNQEFRNHAIQNMSGTSGRQRVPAGCFDHYLLAMPSKEAAIAFGDIARTLMRRISANGEESRTLAAIRDALLPKLLSGEIRVSIDSEQMENAQC